MQTRNYLLICTFSLVFYTLKHLFTDHISIEMKCSLFPTSFNRALTFLKMFLSWSCSNFEKPLKFISAQVSFAQSRTVLLIRQNPHDPSSNTLTTYRSGQNLAHSLNLKRECRSQSLLWAPSLTVCFQLHDFWVLTQHRKLEIYQIRDHNYDHECYWC